MFLCDLRIVNDDCDHYILRFNIEWDIKQAVDILNILSYDADEIWRWKNAFSEKSFE